MVTLLTPAHTEWRNGVLWSCDYEDLYAQQQNPRLESLHVFLKGNFLPERWRLQPRFVLGETGFGIGRNFLHCVQHFCGDHLVYLSTELHPLTAEQLLAAHQGQVLQGVAERLAAHWPRAVPGEHRIYPFRNIELRLLFGDSTAQLQQCTQSVDAWFLDGFAPAKNPAMWSSALLQAVARLSHPGTTVATYSVAGQVRRLLQQTGFKVYKRPGTGGKREFLQAIMP